jgi:transposase
LKLDPLSGHLFVFATRRRDRLNILYWDRDGFAVWAKRLERGTYRIPAAAAGRVEMTAADLAALLAGIDLGTACRRVRYGRMGLRPKQGQFGRIHVDVSRHPTLTP